MRRPVFVLVAAVFSLASCDAPNEPPKSSGPTLYITSPRMDQVFSTDDVEVLFDLRNYAIGKVEEGSNGQHLHLILDNEPYEAIYQFTTATKLKKDKLTPGTHVVRAFPSAGPKDEKGAAHHESRKNPGAFAWVRFHVKEKGGALESFDGKKPLLTYSRPKGEYLTGSPELARFLVDFYVGNVTLKPSAAGVRATLDGKRPTVGGKPTDDWFEWKPWFIDSPAPGEHTMVLELVDADGKPIEGPFNRTERKFTVK
jgi:hypothetical protein